MNKRTKAIGAVTLQAIIIGLSLFFVKTALTYADTQIVLAHRFTVAAACTIGFRSKLGFKDWLRLVPLSAAYPILFFALQTAGLQYVTSSEAGVVIALAPIATALVAWVVLKERLTWAQGAMMALSVAGVVSINVFSGAALGGESLQGILLLLLSVVAIAIYNVYLKKIAGRYSVKTIVFAMSWTAFAVFNGLALSRHLIDGTIEAFVAPLQSVTYVSSILYLGVLSSLLTAMLSAYALRVIEAGTVGLFNNVSTVVTLLAGALLLNEPLEVYHLVGVTMIVTGTVAYTLLKKRTLIVKNY